MPREEAFAYQLNVTPLPKDENMFLTLHLFTFPSVLVTGFSSPLFT